MKSGTKYPRTLSCKFDGKVDSHDSALKPILLSRSRIFFVYAKVEKCCISKKTPTMPLPDCHTTAKQVPQEFYFINGDGGGAGLIYSPVVRMLDGIIMPPDLLLPLLYRGPHARHLCGPTLKIPMVSSACVHAGG
ncbi:hypothetical protein TcWFU_003107 [Taenia crassiceps]|uniref:Uncharacterized protein n=1 Tax=Taenia crassiceps TaxID=6207 RepID=A0ABR4QQ64_9CEST